MRVERSHDLGISGAKRRVDEIAKDLSERLSLTSKWRGDVLHFKGSGASGQITVSDDSVVADIKLGMALMMAQGRIRSAIEKTMDEHIG